MQTIPVLIPFDLSRAMSGAKLVTRDGSPVTEFHLARPGSNYPFDAKVGGKVHSFTRNGTVWIGRADPMDLFMEER
jgi:hypothetical protein